MSVSGISGIRGVMRRAFGWERNWVLLDSWWNGHGMGVLRSMEALECSMPLAVLVLLDPQSLPKSYYCSACGWWDLLMVCLRWSPERKTLVTVAGGVEA